MATLIIVDDDTQMRQTLARRFTRQGLSIIEAGSAEEALARVADTRVEIALIDLHLPGIDGIELLARLKQQQPDLEAILLTAHGSIDTAIQAMKRGAYDYVTKPFHLGELDIHVQKALEKAQLARQHRQLLDQLRYESPRFRLIGGSPAIRRVMQLIERVAPTGSTVLIRGASGTGKELVARALHANSTRRDRPLVTINCAALQETLLESELFGHEKGSFTGAMVSKPGLFELAEGGTLFIDEVAEMAPGLQAKLLRILEDGTYRRVGGTTEYHSDVRVIAATNRPLENEILAGRFREDLFYRLNVFTIPLPLLKDRREDIPELVNHFLNTRPVGGERCRIDPAVIEILQRHDWPGNVRELANVLERAQILSEGGHITPADLPESLIAASGAESVVNSSPENPNALRVIERRHVAEIMRRCNGNKVQAAKQLGVSRRALYRLLAKHDLLGTPQRRGR